MKFPAERILLIATRQIGDVLLCTPLLRSLRCAYPEAVIDVLVFAGREGILKGNADCQRVLTIAERASVAEQWQLMRGIGRRYDLAISTLTGDRPLFYACVAGKWRASLLPSAGRGAVWKKWAIHAGVALDDENTHTVIQVLRLADVLDIKRCYAVVPPSLPSDIFDIKRVLPSLSASYAVLHLVPMWRYKQWTVTHWVQLATALHAEGLQVVLTGGGGAAELAYLRAAMAGMPSGVLNAAGQLSFSAVGYLLARAKVYVGVDTAVTHLAAATGVPTVALFGPTNPVKWAPFPYGYALDNSPFQKVGSQRVGNVFLVQGEGDCVPCHQEGCERHRESTSACLDNLHYLRVLAAVRVMLGIQIGI